MRRLRGGGRRGECVTREMYAIDSATPNAIIVGGRLTIICDPILIALDSSSVVGDDGYCAQQYILYTYLPTDRPTLEAIKFPRLALTKKIRSFDQQPRTRFRC